jgi:hypothetical protein
MLCRRIGLADQDRRERCAAVHLVDRQHPDGLELLVVQEMGLVDDQDGGAAAFGGLVGEGVPGLGGEGGGAVTPGTGYRSPPLCS